MDRSRITADLVAKLVANSFPHWAHLPVVPVELSGWDNVTFRLGPALSVRLPSADVYVAEIDKEHRWLPVLAPLLSLPIPNPIARADPSPDFPRPWSVYGWIEGSPATPEAVPDPVSFAGDLARFLTSLYDVDITGGPPFGPHSFSRGAPVSVWDDQVRDCLRVLQGSVPTRPALEVWEEALAAEPAGDPVWVHGDVVGANLLVRNGRLSAVIDFGCAAVGDPACDLVIAWLFFEGEARRVFRKSVPVDDATWARARGWALWRTLVTLRYRSRAGDNGAAKARQMGWRWDARDGLDQVLDDPLRP